MGSLRFGSAQAIELQELDEVPFRIFQSRDPYVAIVRCVLDELDARVLQPLAVRRDIVCRQPDHVPRRVGISTMHVAMRAESERRPLTGTEDDKARCLRSEEHTSELQSQSNLVCRLLLEKK